jgi:glycosyltransferase involved in cell wall biosynthesis
MTDGVLPDGGRRRSLPGSTVLQIVPALGDEHAAWAALEVALALLRSGARAIVAGGDGPLVAKLQGLGGEWIHMDATTANPLRVRANARAIGELAAAERVDIVHARSPSATLSAAAARPRSAAWLVVSYAGRATGPVQIDRRTARALATADRVISHSHYLSDALVRLGRVAAERIVMIPRRIDLLRFDPGSVSRERASVLRRSWKVQPHERVLLVPGRLDASKGQINIVEAARHLVNGGLRNTVFILAGDNRAQADYARLVAERAAAHGVAHLVRQIGICSDMPAAYVASDLVLVPAIDPPTFGRVAGEALAMGRPVVASDIGALPEFVLAPPTVPEESRTGWLAQPDDPVDLARAVAAALAIDASRYRDISAHAVRLAHALFSPVRIAAATLAVYTSLLEGRD